LDRGLATRQQIIDAATTLFADQGFEAVSIDEILTACGISKGALYHHFAGKEAVFVAVLESVEKRVAAELAAAARGAANPLDALRAGCAGWLALAASDPVVRRIVLTDAPSVMGWQAWRAMESEHSLGLLRLAFAGGAHSGRVETDHVEIFSHMLLAVLTEVALLIANAHGDGDAKTTGAAAIEQMLSGLFGVEPGAPWPKSD
jgi:AcrR family transcriptional regulator